MMATNRKKRLEEMTGSSSVGEGLGAEEKEWSEGAAEGAGGRGDGRSSRKKKTARQVQTFLLLSGFDRLFVGTRLPSI